jgi:hypothetical protein
MKLSPEEKVNKILDYTYETYNELKDTFHKFYKDELEKELQTLFPKSYNLIINYDKQRFYNIIDETYKNKIYVSNNNPQDLLLIFRNVNMKHINGYEKEVSVEEVLEDIIYKSIKFEILIEFKDRLSYKINKISQKHKEQIINSVVENLF